MASFQNTPIKRPPPIIGTPSRKISEKWGITYFLGARSKSGVAEAWLDL